jgi:peptide/nickel transport system substrate-binding protein
MSRKTVILCLLSLIILVSLTTSVLAEVKGPIVDKIYINVKMKEEIGLMDAAEGLTDVFFWGVSGPIIMGLDQATRDKLDIYSVPSGSRSLNFNPIPNTPPYIVKVEEKEYFNPFAIREVRFAMNDLINRQYIVDEILGGAGGPQFVMATPGQPGTYKYGLIATRMGMTAEGNEKKALDEIAEALEKAASLPELQGRLVKQEEWWTFDGEPVTIKFLIRVDCADRSKYGLKSNAYFGIDLSVVQSSITPTQQITSGIFIPKDGELEPLGHSGNISSVRCMPPGMVIWPVDQTMSGDMQMKKSMK